MLILFKDNSKKLSSEISCTFLFYKMKTQITVPLCMVTMYVNHINNVSQLTPNLLRQQITLKSHGWATIGWGENCTQHSLYDMWCGGQSFYLDFSKLHNCYICKRSCEQGLLPKSLPCLHSKRHLRMNSLSLTVSSQAANVLFVVSFFFFFFLHKLNKFHSFHNMHN